MVYKTNNEVLEGFNYVIQATKSKDWRYKLTRNFKIIYYLIAEDVDFKEMLFLLFNIGIMELPTLFKREPLYSYLKTYAEHLCQFGYFRLS